MIWYSSLALYRQKRAGHLGGRDKSDQFGLGKSFREPNEMTEPIDIYIGYDTKEIVPISRLVRA